MSPLTPDLRRVELAASRSRRIFLRAAWANILVGIMGVGVFVGLNFWWSEDVSSRILSLLILMLILGAGVTYVRTITFVEFRPDSVVITFPVTEKVIAYEAIEAIQTRLSRLNPAVSLVILFRGGGRLRGHIAEFETSWGTLTQTERRLKDEFSSRGVAVSS